MSTHNESFAQETRSIFDQHHRQQSRNDKIFDRLVSLVDPEYFGFPASDFSGMRILDAGCGSNANASYAFLTQGAAHVTSLDIGTDWMDCAGARLDRFGKRSKMASGNLVGEQDISDQFDFVHCAGVLHHTSDPKSAFETLARFTRPGGRTYISIMGNGDGIIYQIINYLREKYSIDPAFREIINSANHKSISDAMRWMAETAIAAGDASEQEAEFFCGLFDEDLLLTIKDRLEAPTYHEFRFTEREVRGWFADSGYLDIARIARYTYGFKNMRRFMAPLYLNYDAEVARFLLGQGYIQMIGVKEKR